MDASKSNEQLGTLSNTRTRPRSQRNRAAAGANAQRQVLESVLSIVGSAAPLRAIVVREARTGRRRWLEWHAEGVRTADRRLAKARAENVYRYLVGERDWLAGETSTIEGTRQLIALPLVDSEGAVIGLVQLDRDTPPDTSQLAFADGVAAMLTKALVASYAFEDAQAARYRAEWLAFARGVVLAREEKRRARAEATHDRLAFVANVSALLGSTLEYERAVESVACSAVPRLAHACIIDVLTAAGARTRFAHPSEVVDEAMQSTIEPVVAEVLANGEAAERAVETARRALHMERIISVPLLRHGETYGAITFLVSSVTLESVDRSVAEAVAHRIAAATHNGRVHDSATTAIVRRDVALEMIAHDVKNFANSVLLNAEFMLRHGRTFEPPTTRRPLEAIVRCIHNVTRMMNDLADASHQGAIGSQFESHDCPARSLVVAACDVLEPVARAKGIDLRHDVALDLPLVSADPAQIMRVLSNLIGNAIKFTPAEGTVCVTGEAVGHEVVFSVSDTGAGISREELPRVFDRYWQNPGPKMKLGSGLGLAIAKSVVEAHGGRLWVESSVGIGTTFRFTLRVSGRGVA